MMKQAICLILFLCFFSVESGFAVNKTALLKMKKFSLSKLQATYKKNASLEADFIQEVYQASLGRTKSSKGNLKLSKPNFARWEIYEPEASVMVSNGHKLSYYTPDARGKGKGQVIERKAADLQKQPLFRILTGASALSEEFKVEKQEQGVGIVEGEKWTELVLKPQKKLNDIVQVELKVDPNYLIQELTTETENGNKTKITLQNQTLGAKLPPALFEFKAPADTEVIQN
ncbi:MAG TPA: outer membrane lipoprotein chaperone LolA [Bdellovibrionota bacterium]|jgi:outer membrane lipoprotein carrier protein